MMPMSPKLSSGSRPAPATSWILVGLVGAMLAAWGIRASLASMIFLADGSVLLGVDDSAYHSRRALYSFVNFPAVLLYDQYMAYPGGVMSAWRRQCRSRRLARPDRVPAGFQELPYREE